MFHFKQETLLSCTIGFPLYPISLIGTMANGIYMTDPLYSGNLIRFRSTHQGWDQLESVRVSCTEALPLDRPRPTEVLSIHTDLQKNWVYGYHRDYSGGKVPNLFYNELDHSDFLQYPPRVHSLDYDQPPFLPLRNGIGALFPSGDGRVVYSLDYLDHTKKQIALYRHTFSLLLAKPYSEIVMTWEETDYTVQHMVVSWDGSRVYMLHHKRSQEDLYAISLSEFHYHGVSDLTPSKLELIQSVLVDQAYGHIFSTMVLLSKNDLLLIMVSYHDDERDSFGYSPISRSHLYQNGKINQNYNLKGSKLLRNRLETEIKVSPALSTFAIKGILGDLKTIAIDLFQITDTWSFDYIGSRFITVPNDYGKWSRGGIDFVANGSNLELVTYDEYQDSGRHVLEVKSISWRKLPILTRIS